MVDHNPSSPSAVRPCSRSLAISAAIVVLAWLPAGCGGAKVPKGPSSAPRHVSDVPPAPHASDVPSSSLHTDTPPAGHEPSATHDRLERLAASDSDYRAIICRRIEAIEQRSQSTPDQVYNAMATTEGLATNRASFLALWQSVNELAEGDRESLAGLACA